MCQRHEVPYKGQMPGSGAWDIDIFGGPLFCSTTVTKSCPINYLLNLFLTLFSLLPHQFRLYNLWLILMQRIPNLLVSIPLIALSSSQSSTQLQELTYQNTSNYTCPYLKTFSRSYKTIYNATSASLLCHPILTTDYNHINLPFLKCSMLWHTSLFLYILLEMPTPNFLLTFLFISSHLLIFHHPSQISLLSCVLARNLVSHL